MGSKKLLAMTENGPIPDADSMATDKAVWSWWMPWYNTWSSGFLNQTANTVWAKNLSDSRVISLDKMPGWANYQVNNLPNNKQLNYSVNMELKGRMLSINIPNGTANVTLYDILGHQIALNTQSSGSRVYNLQNMAQGQYIVQVKGDHLNASKWIVIH